MKLLNTEKLMNSFVAENYCDSYAVAVFHEGELGELTSEKVNRDTYFDMASCGKVLVTSNLILHAISEGRLRLDDPLEKFFDTPEDKKKITVKQLLTHTSGIIRYPLPRAVCERGHGALADYILEKPLKFAPGTHYTYSCNGYILLGFILEKIYEKKLSEIFEDELKPALGLTRASFTLPEGETNRVISHRRESDGDFPADDENLYEMRETAGSGGQFYTLSDMEKTVQAIYDRNPALYKEELFCLAEKDWNPDLELGRGLGYFIMDRRYAPEEKLFSEASFGHTGSTGTSFFIDREKKLYVILLTNMRRGITAKLHVEYDEYTRIVKEFRSRVHEAVKEDLGI